jgi:hypothetical protein
LYRRSEHGPRTASARRAAAPWLATAWLLTWGGFSVAASDELQLDLRARALQPGEVIALEVRAPGPLGSVQVRAFGVDAACVPAGARACRALVPIDLDVTPGEYVVTVETESSGTPLGASEHVTILDKEFATRTLRVDPDFVTPPKRMLPRIAREAALLRRLFARVTPLARWRGAFRLPVPETMVSGFGVRSVFNGQPRSPHSGADFASRAGTPVRAPNGGTVVLARALYFTGNTVVIDHGAGLYSLLAHLSRMRVAVGRAVQRGAIVGAVGATGRATGPHLHWTVRLDGARVDPISLVYATAATAQ